jgi:dipeptidase D
MMSATQVYEGLEPRELWRHFGELNGTPRPSKKEAAARDYVLRVAAAAGAEAITDARGNAIIRVPATTDGSGAPSVAVQAHLDMVCEKRPGVQHDFDTDPIRPRIEGDWVYATGTTLGSDNGIGAAAALALLTERGLAHGPLELLFTVEEETGLHGAANLDPSQVRSRLMINLDSEDPSVLTVGCAGGAGTILRVPARREPPPPVCRAWTVHVSGLKGGHSGVQIHERLANAIKLLTHVLRTARGAGVPLRIAAIHGGNAHNAIPRDASATVVVPADQGAALEAAVRQTADVLRAEWAGDEPGLSVDVHAADYASEALTAGDSERLIGLLEALPHGVLTWSRAFEGKVETSSNLAQIALTGDAVEIATSSRSFVDAELDRVQAEIQELGRAAGAVLEVRDGYGGWEPNPDSMLLAVTRSVYEDTFRTPPVVEVIHAGLECGIIVSRMEGMEAISFGPRIQGAHTPEERVEISTVASTWNLLVALLAELARPDNPAWR